MEVKEMRKSVFLLLLLCLVLVLGPPATAAKDKGEQADATCLVVNSGEREAVFSNRASNLEAMVVNTSPPEIFLGFIETLRPERMTIELLLRRTLTAMISDIGPEQLAFEMGLSPMAYVHRPAYIAFDWCGAVTGRNPVLKKPNVALDVVHHHFTIVTKTKIDVLGMCLG